MAKDKATFKIPRGANVVDVVTGFAGQVTGRADYVTGCNQYLVQPPVDKEGKYVAGQWFDENRLNCSTAGVESNLEAGRENGACGEAPTK